MIKASTRSAPGAFDAESFQTGQTVLLGIRPENITIASSATNQLDQMNQISVEIIDQMHLGARVHLHARATGEERLLCELGSAAIPLQDGQHAGHWEWPIADTLVYPLARHDHGPADSPAAQVNTRQAEAQVIGG